MKCASIRQPWLVVVLLLVTDLTFAESVPDVAFLTITQGQAAIIDEQIEPYFSLLQPREMSAKTGIEINGATLDAQRDACRKRYQAAVQEFSAAEQAALRHVVTTVHPFLESHYPLFAAEPWRFMKVAPTIEGGLPHTRGTCIVLSDSELPMFIAGEAKPQNPHGINLLVHEQTHVLQRLHPELFVPLFIESWGFVRMPHAPTVTVDLTTRQLINPDGVSCLWILPRNQDGKSEYILPQILLGGDAKVPRMPADFLSVGLMVERQGDEYVYSRDPEGKSRSTALEDVSIYARSFDPSEENFHPNEICAELFSRMVTLDMLHRHENETPCQQGLRGWASAYFGSTKTGLAHARLPRMAPPQIPAESSPKGPTDEETEHILGKGETLVSVAKHYHVTLKWLIVRNEIVTDPKEGLHLIVPRLTDPAKP